VRINNSLCPVALKLEYINSFYSKAVEHGIYNGHVKKTDYVEHNQTYIQDLTISSSRNNIIVVTVQDIHEVHPILFLGNISFTENQGSIIVINAKLILQGNVQILNNRAHDRGSVFLIRDDSTVSFQGDIAFEDNIGKEGGALSTYSSDIKFQGDIIFINNRGREGGALSSYSSDVKFEGDIVYLNNSGWQGGAVSAYSSNIKFQGRVRFIGNIAETAGGGISLREGSTIFLETTTSVSFCTNTAFEYGGGIFVDETMLWESNKTLKCFVQTSNVNNTIMFENNEAELAGMAIFGGWIDNCNPERYAMKPSYTFKNHGRHYMDEYSDISSNAARVCICEHSRPNCNITSYSIETIPGRSFEIEAVAVGQRFGVASAVVKAELPDRHGIGNNIIIELQRSQDVGTYCTVLSYTVSSRNKNETMQLVIDRQQVPKPNPSVEFNILQFQQLQINIILNDCPLGFNFNFNRNICECHYSLEKQGIRCNTSSQTVIREGQKWIGVHENQIIINHHCPYDYCKTHDISLNLSSPNDQCAFSRSGILCGACQSGKSEVLGTSNCKSCSDAWLLLLLLFGLAGVALVVCLIVLNLTVSTGTINGLIFYANIVRANNAIFFPGQSANNFLSWFIAWLNLDLGIETCFYHGLTGYAKTLLQFVFPVYIWALVSIIIVSSHYSTRAARMCGNNAVQVLATLFFLSYAKLIRVTVAVFQPSQLLFPLSNGLKLVWNYDGNLDYLSGHHLVLFVLTLLFFVTLFIPYTLALFGIQWLQPISHYKALFWVNKLKPLFDAYTGPYKDKHRYWTGLLLLLRIGLLCIFSANTTGDPAINLLVTVIVIVCLFVYLGLLGGVYKYWPLNVLEYIFFLNVVILSAGALYIIAAEKSIHPVTHFSVGITLAITIFIVFYHAIQSFVKRCHMKEKIWTLIRTISRERNNHIDVDVQQYDLEDLVHPASTVTYSIVKMEEKLLSSTSMNTAST
jgi:predicted outer membrane repeat protein